MTETEGAELGVDQLTAIMPNLSRDSADYYLPYLNAAVAEAQINTLLRQAAFLANLALESGEVRWFEELADGWAYVGREDLGNVYEGDGPRYKGRGPIQLTGRANYRRAGAALGLGLEGSPEQAATLEVGFRIAGWHWNQGSVYGDLNVYADTGDFVSTFHHPGGGYNGYESRWAYYQRALQVLDV